MGYTDREELDKITGINNICDRILLEIDETYPWITIIKYLVEKLKREYGEKQDD